MAAPKALDAVGKNLQAQYERWQPRAKYRIHLDPTTEDVKKVAISCRRTAKNERVLFHYNGHGVPRPTANGEIWVFNKSYTQYIPLSVYDLQTWVGSPALYVLDCSSAGQVLNSFKAFMTQRSIESAAAHAAAHAGQLPPGSNALPPHQQQQQEQQPLPDPMKDIILLCACSENELLPLSPDLPADVFTACLTTPIKVALRWFCSRSLLRFEGLAKELIDRIPGKQTDRKTPLGELNWIFTAITDTIAWNVLPRSLFQKLFRQDLLVASLFRNFLLAERVMRAANCTPVSHPRLPPTHQHPMWQAWDLAAEACLLQLPALLSSTTLGGAAAAAAAAGGSSSYNTGGPGIPPTGNGITGNPAAGGPTPRSHMQPGTPVSSSSSHPQVVEYKPSPFFSEQLTAFELWLEHGGPDKRPPEQLPIVLQVLLSQVHRLRALALLGRFLDMGCWAVDLALSVGIFPYVLKLLQTTAPDLKQTLVFIWTKILAWDSNAQVQGDLVKDGGHLYFLKHLDSKDPNVPPDSRAQAAFVLASICDNNPKGQVLCAQAGLLQICAGQLPAACAALASAENNGDVIGAGDMGLLVRWLVLAMSKMWENVLNITGAALTQGVQETLARLLAAQDPEVRATSVFGLGSLILTETSPMMAAATNTVTSGGSNNNNNNNNNNNDNNNNNGGGAPGGGTRSSVDKNNRDAENKNPEFPPQQHRDQQPPPPPPPPLQQQPSASELEAQRLNTERAIACALLELVYDASSLVRAELASALARLATGHSLFFHDAVHDHQKTSATIQSFLNSALDSAVAASAPAGGGGRGGMPTGSLSASVMMPPSSLLYHSSAGAGGGGRLSSSMASGGSGSGGGMTMGVSAPGSNSTGGGSYAARRPPPPPSHHAPHHIFSSSATGAAGGGGGALMSSSTPGGGSSSSSSAGMRLREELAGYEPMLTVGLGTEYGAGLAGTDNGTSTGTGDITTSSTTTASNTEGEYASSSAEAAQVRGGLYLAVVEALCTLATDPSPRVAAAGRAALRAANVEIIIFQEGLNQKQLTTTPLSRRNSLDGPMTGTTASVGGGGSATSRPSTPPIGPAGGSSKGGGGPPFLSRLSGGSGGGDRGSGGGSSLIPKSWQPKSWRSQQQPTSPANRGTPTPTTTPTNAPTTTGTTTTPFNTPTASGGLGPAGGGGTAATVTCRPAFRLRILRDDGTSIHGSTHGVAAAAAAAVAAVPGGGGFSRVPSFQSMGSNASGVAPPPGGGLDTNSLGGSGSGSAVLVSASSSLLPHSAAYKHACEQFRWPLLGSKGPSTGGPLMSLGLGTAAGGGGGGGSIFSDGSGAGLEESISNTRISSGSGSNYSSQQQQQQQYHPSMWSQRRPVDESLLRRRRTQRADDLAKCRAVAAPGSMVRLKERVVSVNTEAASVSAMLLEPYLPAVTTVDKLGVVRVTAVSSSGGTHSFNSFDVSSRSLPSSVDTTNTNSSTFNHKQRFHGQHTSITSLYRLNDETNGLLMACAADGAVRIWRRYTALNEQRLAAAWQAVLLPTAGVPAAMPAVYEWSKGYSVLFAAGGSNASRVYAWDVQREHCISRLDLGIESSSLSSSGGGGGSAGASTEASPVKGKGDVNNKQSTTATNAPSSRGVVVDKLGASPHSPILYTSDTSGMIRVFDLRASRVVGTAQPVKNSRLAGMAVEPGGNEHQLAVAYPSGTLSFLDSRLFSGSRHHHHRHGGSSNSNGDSSLQTPVWRSVEAHNKGSVTALAAHAHAPLLATSTATQVVKVWSCDGEQIGVVRAHTSYLAQRIGRTTALTWAQYGLQLASGGDDSIVAVYSLEVGGKRSSTESSGSGGGGGRRPPTAF